MFLEFMDSVNQERLEAVCVEFDVLAIYFLETSLMDSLTGASDYLLGVVFSSLEKQQIKKQQFKNKLNSTLEAEEVDILFLQLEELEVSFEVITAGEIVYAGEEEKVINYEDKIISQGLEMQENLDLYYEDVHFSFDQEE